ncbi:MAG: V-type ATP synthase subunit D [Nitrospirae bacterium]|nr:V-type ATP synthase subunit D [Nitrospirota bacterium]
METVSPTRMNLLIKKDQIAIAEDGLELLRSKRESLVKEFFAIMGSVVSARDRLRRDMQEAVNKLTVAIAMDGREKVASASFAAKRDILVDIVERNIWGTRFSEIEYKEVARSPDARGYSLISTSTFLDDTASAFEKVIDLILKMVSEENRLKILGEEIKKVTRRINALNEVIVPELKKHVRYIRTTLEEREREDLFRLKRLKVVGWAVPTK